MKAGKEAKVSNSNVLVRLVSLAGCAMLLGCATLLAGCGASLTTASAGEYVEATATVWLLGSNHVVYRVAVDLLAPTAPSPALDPYASETETYNFLVVSIAACPGGKCGSTTPYVQQLTAAGASGNTAATPTYNDADLGQIAAQTPGWGSRLTANWTGTAPSSLVDTGSPTLTADGGIDTSTSWTAKATVALFGVSCPDQLAQVTRHTNVTPLGVVPPWGKSVPRTWVPDLPPLPVRCVSGPAG